MKQQKRKDPKRVAAAKRGWVTRRANIALAAANKRAEYQLVSILQTAVMTAAEAEYANTQLNLAALNPPSDYRWMRNGASLCL